MKNRRTEAKNGIQPTFFRWLWPEFMRNFLDKPDFRHRLLELGNLDRLALFDHQHLQNSEYQLQTSIRMTMGRVSVAMFPNPIRPF